ncbi:phage tail family protein [Streptomyces sp. DT117]|uniref:phage tail family protein n=1 Tax=Streptomyces sp. DT117 TaxID=3393422 RepID=UPI003CFA6DE0
MISLRLESERDTLDLNGIAESGVGYQALAGVTGLGLPEVSVQWLTGAGDGAVYRGKRVLARDIDLPLDIVGRDRKHLSELLSRLARTLDGPCTLSVAEGDGTTWSTQVVHVGGGDYSYGGDGAGETDLQTVITLRAPDPYFSASELSAARVGGTTGASPFLSQLVAMPLSASQQIGTIELDNTGDVRAYPTWEVYGPGDNFKAISPTGETLHWQGSLTANQRLIIDTQAGTVVDGTGANRYSLLAAAPRFWTLPAGVSTATASLLNTTPASKIVCTWRPRKWMVI